MIITNLCKIYNTYNTYIHFLLTKMFWSYILSESACFSCKKTKSVSIQIFCFEDDFNSFGIPLKSFDILCFGPTLHVLANMGLRFAFFFFSYDFMHVFYVFYLSGFLFCLYMFVQGGCFYLLENNDFCNKVTDYIYKD